MDLEQIAKEVGLPYELAESLRYTNLSSSFEICLDSLFYSTTDLQASQSRADYLADQYPSNLIMIALSTELDRLNPDSGSRSEVYIKLFDDSFPDLIELLQAYSRI